MARGVKGTRARVRAKPRDEARADEMLRRWVESAMGSPHAQFGVRFDDADYAIGDELPESRVWDNDEVVEGEYLPGTSTVGLGEEFGSADLSAALDRASEYPSARAYLVGGRGAQWGADDGERIIDGATVIGRLSGAAPYVAGAGVAGAALAPGEAEAGLLNAALSPALRSALTKFSRGEAIDSRSEKAVLDYLERMQKDTPFGHRERLRLADEDTPDVGVLDRRIVAPADLHGRVGVPVMGDRSIAGARIDNVEGVPLSAPLQLQGGPNYGLANDGTGLGWASMQNAAQTKQNQITRAAEQSGADPVGVYTAMGNDAMHFNTMTTEAALRQLHALKVPRNVTDAFNESIRKTVPDFDGIETEGGMAQLVGLAPATKASGQPMTPSNLRKLVTGGKGLGAKRWENEGLPVMEDVIRSITEPELRGVRRGDSGFSLFEGKPGAELLSNSQHRTYSHGIPGDYIGGLDRSVPASVMFPDLYAKQSDKLNKAGKPFSDNEKVGAVQMGGDYQNFDDKWLEGIEGWLAKQQDGAATPSRLAATALTGAAGVAGVRALDANARADFSGDTSAFERGQQNTADREQWAREATARRDARIQREDLARQRQYARADRLRAIDGAISDALRRPTYHTPEGEQIPAEVAQMRRARGEPVIEQSSPLGDVLDFVRPSPAAAAAWIEPMTGANSAAAERAMSVLDVPGVLMGFAVDQILEGME